jgi:hypothetical protein
MLGLSRDAAEASLHSERAARAVLTRRNLLAAGGALATGAAFSFAAPEVEGFWVVNPHPIDDGLLGSLGGLLDLPRKIGETDNAYRVRLMRCMLCPAVTPLGRALGFAAIRESEAAAE